MARRAAFVALLLVLVLSAPSVASAVTLADIVALSKAGVPETVLLALIDRDKSVFAIEADDLVTLKDAGVSEAVIIAMLGSGREPLPPAPTAAIASTFPTLVIVGHGPDRPNTSRRFERVEPALPYLPYLPFLVVGSTSASRCVTAGTSRTPPASTGPPLGRFTSDLGTRYLVNGVGRIAGNASVAPESNAAPVVDCPQASPPPPPPARPRPRR